MIVKGCPSSMSKSDFVRFNTFVAFLTCIAAALRFLWLGSASLWIDELFSVSWSQLNSAYLVGSGAHIETNPSDYYLLLHFWIQAFGNSEYAVRSLSVLASVATVPVVYALGRALFDRRTSFDRGAANAALIHGLMLAEVDVVLQRWRVALVAGLAEGRVQLKSPIMDLAEADH